jgi:predicted SnoaL-like aldol condensation-catalyzing enzyme
MISSIVTLTILLFFTVLFTYATAFVSLPQSFAQTNQTSSVQSQKEIRNENIVREFYNNVFIAKNASAAVNYIEEDYIQHNPTVPTGREAFINEFIQIFERNPNFNTEIQRIYTDGDYVIVHSSFSLMKNNTGNAVVDIYRINDEGKMAEHWDVIQSIPPNPANNNTLFYLE